MNRSTVAGVVYYFSLVFGFKMIVRLSLSTKFEMCLLLTTRMTRKNQNLQIEWHFSLRELLQTFLSPHTHLHKIMHTCTRIHSRTHSWTLWVKLGEVCWIRESGCIPGYNGLTRSHTHIQTHTHIIPPLKAEGVIPVKLRNGRFFRANHMGANMQRIKLNKAVDFTVQIYKCVLRNQVWEHWLTRLD